MSRDRCQLSRGIGHPQLHQTRWSGPMPVIPNRETAWPLRVYYSFPQDADRPEPLPHSLEIVATARKTWTVGLPAHFSTCGEPPRDLARTRMRVAPPRDSPERRRSRDRRRSRFMSDSDILRLAQTLVRELDPGLLKQTIGQPPRSRREVHRASSDQGRDIGVPPADCRRGSPGRHPSPRLRTGSCPGLDVGQGSTRSRRPWCRSVPIPKSTGSAIGRTVIG
jgi:hypothetical protein